MRDWPWAYDGMLQCGLQKLLINGPRQFPDDIQWVFKKTGGVFVRKRVDRPPINVILCYVSEQNLYMVTKQKHKYLIIGASTRLSLVLFSILKSKSCRI